MGDDPAETLVGQWMGWSPANDIEGGIRKFRLRYGKDPDRYYQMPNLLYVGPIEEKEIEPL